MTREEAIEYMNEQLLKVELSWDEAELPLSHLTDANNVLRCTFNDPRFETIEVEYE